MLKKFIFVLLMLTVVALVVGRVKEVYSESMSTISNQGASGVPILMYHKVNYNPATGGHGLRVNPREFEKQMATLARNGYTTISLTDLIRHQEQEKELPDKPIIITFDDGYHDNYKYAYPILKKYRMTATFFVVAGTVGGVNEFDYHSGKQPKNKMANWQELMEMADGGMTIGAHTVNHPHLADVKPQEAWREIVQSKIIVEKALQRPVDVFAYPYGSYNRTAVDIVSQSGFLAAVTTEQGLGNIQDGRYTLKRIRVRGDYNINYFLHELNRHYTEKS